MQANHLDKQNHLRLPALRTIAPVLGVLLILAFWQGITMLNLYPSFIIPPPISVVQRFIDVAIDAKMDKKTFFSKKPAKASD